MLRRGSRQLLLVVAFLFVFGPALADEIKGLGAFKRWDAYYYTENDAKICYIASRPVKEEGDYVRRGEVFILVTHRPPQKPETVVSFQAGYSFKEGTSVTITIDKVTRFTLFTEGDLAWAEDTKTDQALIAAMKKGSRMVVGGTSKRGTKTTDTYSLAGFTASIGPSPSPAASNSLRNSNENHCVFGTSTAITRTIMEGRIEKLGPLGSPPPAHEAATGPVCDLVGLSREELGDVFAGLGESLTG